jgi:hypothetical protein
LFLDLIYKPFQLSKVLIHLPLIIAVCEVTHDLRDIGSHVGPHLPLLQRYRLLLTVDPLPFHLATRNLRGESKKLVEPLDRPRPQTLRVKLHGASKLKNTAAYQNNKARITLYCSLPSSIFHR